VQLAAASQSITGDLTITGNVTISGNFTTVETTTVTTSDNVIIINSGEVGAGVTAGNAGIQVDRGTLDDYYFTFRESDDSFVIGTALALQKVATRQDSPLTNGLVWYNNSEYRFDTTTGLTFASGVLNTPGAIALGAQATTTSHAVRGDRTITIAGTANQVISSAGAQNLTGDRT
jgi:hypothetical protein